MAGLTIGGLSRTGRKFRKKGTKSRMVKKTQGYYRQNMLKPFVSTNSSLYAAHIPAQVAYTLRLAYTSYLTITAGDVGGTIDQSMIQPRTNPGTPADWQWAGGLLAFMRIYDKCATLKCTMTQRISPRATTVTGVVQNTPVGGAAVCLAVMSREAANGLGPTLDNLDRMRDIPFSQYKHVGSVYSGHDVVTLTGAVDIEKWMAAPQDVGHTVRRVGNTINSYATGDPIMQQTPCSKLMIIPEQPVAERVAGQTTVYFVESEFNYTLLFSGLRNQVKNLGDINEDLNAAQG